MVTSGLDGLYQQVIPYTTGPMSCAKHRWAISRLNKFSSSCWGKICIRVYFFPVFLMHNILKRWSHTVLPRAMSCLFLERVMGQNFQMQEVRVKAIITVDGILPQTRFVVGVDLKDAILQWVSSYFQSWIISTYSLCLVVQNWFVFCVWVLCNKCGFFEME